MKNILSEITQEEKNRILEMHKTATSKFYLNEDVNMEDMASKIESATDEKQIYDIIKSSFPGESEEQIIKNIESMEQSTKPPHWLIKLKNWAKRPEQRKFFRKRPGAVVSDAQQIGFSFAAFIAGIFSAVKTGFIQNVTHKIGDMQGRY
jgi:hypothetical protein